jgi:hypothetical protein
VVRIAGRVGVLIAAVGLAVGALVVALVVPHGAPAHPAQDSQCNAPFPVKLFPNEQTEARLRHMIVCSNRAGTATLILNRTRAVWVIDTPTPRPVYRLHASEDSASFLDLIGSAAHAVPSGSSVILLSPATTTQLRVDAALTLAELVHDQLLTALGSLDELRRAAADASPSSARRALTSCLHAILDQLGEPRRALAHGGPAPAVVDAAKRVGAETSSDCVLDWLQAKMDSGMPSVDVTPFAYDVVGWSADDRFAGYVVSAGETYRGVSAGADAEAEVAR